MPDYEVETATHHIGADDYQIRSLIDRQQFSDPDGSAERAGICSASWPLFGIVWPAGLALAQEMSGFAIAGKSILEVGCGIGLSSLVLQRRGANITTCDYHPLAKEFLRRNTDLNGLLPIRFFNAPWAGPNPELGRFDLIIGSDLLYERDHAGLLAGFLACHANPVAQIVVADPGRTYCNQFGARLEEQGYARTERRLSMNLDAASRRGRMMSFIRGPLPPPTTRS